MPCCHPRQRSHPPRWLSHDSGSIWHSGARQGSGMGRRWSCRAFFSRVWHSLPGRHTDWVSGTRVLSGARMSPPNPLNPGDRIRPPWGRGEPSQGSARQRQSTSPCPALPCPGRGTPNPGELRGQRQGPLGLRRAKAGRTCRGPGKDKGTRGCPCPGTASAPGIPGAAAALGRGIPGPSLPRPAAAQGALVPAPLPARCPAPRDAGCGMRPGPAGPPHLKSL